MGANLTTLRDSKGSKSDADFSQLHLSAVFNDAYVQSVCDDLPEYTLLALADDKAKDKSTNEQTCTASLQGVKLDKLMAILSPSLPDSNVNDQQDTDSWIMSDSVNRKSAFVYNNRNRLRLLLRVYQAYEGILAKQKALSNTAESSGEGNDATNALSRSVEALMLRRGQAMLGGLPESSSDVLAAMSISMSTTIARTLGLANPPLLVSLADNLMEIVGAVHPDAGQGLQRAVHGAGALGKALEAIASLAREMHQNSALSEVQSAGAGLLLAVALVNGSVQSIVEVATLLLTNHNTNNSSNNFNSKSNALKLPLSARRMLEKYLNQEESYAFKLLADKYVSAQFKVPSLEVEESNKFLVRIQPALTSAATDGSSLYAFNGLGTGCINKIGTGLHGTLAGDVILRVTNLRGQLSAHYESQQPALSSVECEAKFTTAEALWVQPATPLCFGDLTSGLAVNIAQRAAEQAVVFPGFCTTADLRNERFIVSASGCEGIGPREVSEGSDDDEDDDDEAFFGAYIDMPFDLRDAASRAVLRERLESGIAGNYCEIEGIAGDDGLRILGLSSPARYDVNDSDQTLGWDSGTFAYHSDDGNIFVDGETTGSGYAAWEEENIIVGVGVVVTESDSTMFFTRNGVKLPDFSIRVPLGEILRPCVALRGWDHRVRLNTGAQPFVYQGEEVRLKTRNEPSLLQLGANATDTHGKDKVLGSVAVGHEFVYAHLENVLAPTQVAVFHKHSLKLRSVCDIGDAIVQHKLSLHTEVSAGESNTTDSQKVYHFEFSGEEEIYIGTAGEGVLNIVSANLVQLNAVSSVTETVQTYLNTSSTVLRLLPVGHPSASVLPSAVHSFPASAKLTISCTVLAPTAHGEAAALRAQLEQSLVLPIAACGNLFVCVEAAAEPAEGLRGVCFDPAQSVTFTRASFGEYPPANSTPDPAAEANAALLVAVRHYWSRFLWNSGSAGSALETDSAQFWSEIAAYIPAAVPTEYSWNRNEPHTPFLYIQVSVDGGAPFTVSFKEGQLDFPALLVSVQQRLLKLENRLYANVLDLTNPDTPKVLQRTEIHHKGALKNSRRTWADFHFAFNGAVLCIYSIDTMFMRSHVAMYDLLSPRDGQVVTPNDPDLLAHWHCETESGPAIRFCCDTRNNFLWSWNPNTSTVQRWHNRWPVPPPKSLLGRYTFQNGLQALPTVLPHAVKSRASLLRALADETGDDTAAGDVASDSALLLTVLEGLAQPYAPTDWEVEADGVEILQQIRIAADYFENGKAATGRITVQGHSVDFSVGNTSHERVRVVLLNENFRVTSVRDVVPDDSGFDFREVGDFLNDTPEGTLVLVCATCVTFSSFHPTTLRALLGCGANAALGSSEHERDRTLLLIGRRGMRPGDALQVIGKQSTSCELQCAAPLVEVPLALEVTGPSLASLIAALELFFQRCVASSVTTCDKMALLSVLQLLKVNMFRLSVLPADIFKTILTPAQGTSLQELLLKLIHSEVIMCDPTLEDALLGLFFSAATVLYPNVSDQMALLELYMGLYSAKTITRIELYILTFVLKKISDMRSLVQLLADNSTDPMQFFFSLETIYLGEMKVELQHFQGGATASADLASSRALSHTVVSAMVSFTKLMLAAGAKPFFCSFKDNTASAVVAAGSKLFAVITHAVVRMCHQVLDQVQQIVAVKAALGRNNNNAELFVSVQELLQNSPLHTVLPLVLTVFSNVATNCGYTFVHPVIDSIADVVNALTSLHTQLRTFLPLLPADTYAYNDALTEAEIVSKTIESEHPYRSNMDQETPLSFPGAVSVTIVFDAATRMENGCDYVVFRDAEGNQMHSDRYTGRDGSENYPGTGGRPPLVLEGSEFVEFFHSDGSMEDWGYKYTITPTFPARPKAVNATHWMVRLEFELVQCTAALASALVVGLPWQEALETEVAPWMADPLIRPELFRWEEARLESAGDALLRGLVDRTPGTRSAALALTMRRLVQEDQGTVEEINRAVYATCAAIIKTKGLVHDALAVALGNTPAKAVPQGLVKAWRRAQRVRGTFDKLLQQSEEGLNAEMSPEVLLQQQQQKSAELVTQTSVAIVSRALFLLRTPEGSEASIATHFSLSASEDATAGEDHSKSPSPGAIAMGASSQAHPYALPEPPSYSTSPVPSRTPLLGPPLAESDDSPMVVSPFSARSGGSEKKPPMMRQVSNDTMKVSNLWRSLVDEESLYEKLKALLAHRRRLAAVQKHTADAQSVADRVLAFVLSTVEVSKLEEANSWRNKRAILRSKGLDIFANILSTVSHPFAQTLVAKSISTTLRATKRDDLAPQGTSKVHFMNAVEGCSPEQGSLVWEKFSALLRINVQALKRSREKRAELWTKVDEAGVPTELQAAEGAALEGSIVSSLACCAVDYDISDQALVSESGLLQGLLEVLQARFTQDHVKLTAEKLFESLVAQFMKPSDSAGSTTNKILDGPGDESTNLCRHLVQMLLSRFENEAAKTVPLLNLINMPPAPPTTEVLEGAVSIIPTIYASHRFDLGCSFPAHALRTVLTEESNKDNTGRTYSLWVKRPRSTLTDVSTSTDGTDNEFVTPTVGAFVMPGPQFNWATCEFGGGLDTLGTVTKVLNAEEAVMVLWPSNKTTKCTVSRVNNIRQVVVVDPAVGGHLFSVGTPGLLRDINSSRVGLVLLPDARLCMFGDAMEDLNLRFKYYVTEEKIPAEAWTHIAVYIDRSKGGLYINGHLVQQFLNSNQLDSSELDGSQAPPDLTSAPLFLGQLPFFHGMSDPPSSSTAPGEAPKAPLLTVSLAFGADALIAAFCTHPGLLDEEQIASLAKNTPVSAGLTQCWDDAPLLSILAVVRKGLEKLDNFSDPAILRLFCEPALLKAIFSVLLKGTALLRASMYHVCASIFPNLSMEIVEKHARDCGFIPPAAKDQSFVDFLLRTVGASSNAWSRLVGAQDNTPSEARLVGEAEYGVAMAQLVLLKALCTAKSTASAWVTETVRSIQTVLKSEHELVAALTRGATEEFANSESLKANITAVDVNRKDQLNRLFGVLNLLGGEFPVLYAGALAVCADEASNVREDCLVLGYTANPIVDAKTDKDAAMLWKNAATFGDAVAVMVLNNANKHVVVHRSRLEVAGVPNLTCSAVATTAGGGSAVDEKLNQFLQEKIGADQIIRLFALISSIETKDHRPVPQPRTVDVMQTLEFESAHPYPDNQSTNVTICIPGAEKLHIRFDERTATTGQDVVIFFTDNKLENRWGQEYCGFNGDGNWPGFEGRPELVIPASSVVLNFKTGSSSEVLWGYKCTVQGTAPQKVYPPGLPTLPYFAQLVQLKMVGMKALRGCLERYAWLVPHSLSLVRGLVESALSPAPATPVQPVVTQQSVTTMYESSHPYENSLEVYTPISFPGATRLSIVFDEQTRTELNCDFVAFYTDITHSVQVPDTCNYTGGKDGGTSNWPGMQGRPPLVIESDSIVMFFRTDGSVNDWGWRMFVTAEFSSATTGSTGPEGGTIRGQNLGPTAAAARCFYLQQYLLDGPILPTFADVDAELYERKAPIERCVMYVDVTEQDETLMAYCMQKADSKHDAAAESKEEHEGMQLKEEKASPADGNTPSVHLAGDDVAAQDPAGAKEDPVIVHSNKYPALYPMGFISTRETITVLTSSEAGAAALGQLKLGDRILALTRVGDWLQVQLPDNFQYLPVAANNAFALSVLANLASSNGSSNNTAPPVSCPAVQPTIGWVQQVVGGFDQLEKDPTVPGSNLVLADVEYDMCSLSNEVMKVSTLRTASLNAAKLSEPRASDAALAKHPMYGVADTSDIGASVGVSNSPGANNSSAFYSAKLQDQSLLIRSEIQSLEAAAVEYAVVAALGYAFEALRVMLSVWPEEEALTVNSFGSLSNLLTFLNLSLQRCGTNVVADGTSGIGLTHQRVLSLLRDNAHIHFSGNSESHDALSVAMVDFASSHLHSVVQRNLPLTPNTILDQIPSPVPTYQAVSTNIALSPLIPTRTATFKGAQKIRLVRFVPAQALLVLFGFDMQWEVTAEQRLSIIDGHFESIPDGGKLVDLNSASAAEIFLENTDTCSVYYLHDHRNQGHVGYNVINLTAYGIYRDLDEVAVTDYCAQFNGTLQRHRDMFNQPQFPQLACWLLTSFLSYDSPAVQKRVYTVKTFQVLRQAYNTMSDSALQEIILQVLVSYISAITAQNRPLSGDFLAEFRTLQASLTETADARYQKETKNGYDLLTITPQLQAMVQLIVSIDQCISQATMRNLLPNNSRVSATPEVDNEVVQGCKKVSDLLPQWSSPVRDGESLTASAPTAVDNVWTVQCTHVPPLSDSNSAVEADLVVGLSVASNDSDASQVWVGLSSACKVVFPSHGSELLNVVPPSARRPLTAGDFVSVSVNYAAGTVRFFVNSAPLGLAVGPVGSGAVIEATLPKSLVPFVKIRATENAALPKFVATPAAVVVFDTAKGFGVTPTPAATRGTPSWLEKVITANSLLHDIDGQTIPTFVLNNVFVPMVVKRSAVQVMWDNEAFTAAQGNVKEVEVSLPGALGVKVMIKQSKVAKNDVIEVLNEAGDCVCKMQCEGNDLKRKMNDGAAFLQKVVQQGAKYAESKLLSDSASASAWPAPKVGDVVVRGPDWCYGEVDGGIGGTGMITKVTNMPWSLETNTGVQVRWDASGREDIYRYGASGIQRSGKLYDVQRLRRAVVGCLDQDYCIDVPGSKATFRLTKTTPAAGTEEAPRSMGLVFFPVYSLQTCLAKSEYQPVLEQMQQLYVPNKAVGGIEADLALVRHMDSVVAAKKFYVSDVFKKGWTHFQPTSEDLTRSPAFKLLCEATSVAPMPKTANPFDGEQDQDNDLLFPEGGLSDRAQQQQQASQSVRFGVSSAQRSSSAQSDTSRVGLFTFGVEAGDTMGHADPAASAAASTGALPYAVDESQPAFFSSFGATRFEGVFGGTGNGTTTAPNIGFSFPPSAPSAATEPLFQHDFFRGLLATSSATTNNDPLAVPFIFPPETAASSSTSRTIRGARRGGRMAGYGSRRVGRNRVRPPREHLSWLDSATPASSGLGDHDNEHHDDHEEHSEHYSDDDEGHSDHYAGDHDFFGNNNVPAIPAAPVSPAAAVSVPMAGSEASSVVSLTELFGADNAAQPSDAGDAEDSEDLQSGRFFDHEQGEEEDTEVSDEDEEEHSMSDSSSSASESRSTTSRSSRNSDPRTPREERQALLNAAALEAREANASKLPVCAKCRLGLTRKPQGTWNTGWTCDWPLHEGRNGFTCNDCVHGCPTVIQCNWGVCDACWHTCEVASMRDASETLQETASKLDMSKNRPIHAHFHVIQLLNQLLIAAIPFVNLADPSPVPGSLAHLVLKYRGLMYEVAKMGPISSALDVTAATTSTQFDLNISRSRARKHAQSGQPDRDARYSVYAQAFRVMHGMPPSRLRRSDKLYSTKFMGEHAVDGGGPYRESFMMYTQELQSTALSLLLRTPNGRHGVGFNREKWILNPGATSSVEMEMFAFLGKLMGIAMRSKDYLALNLPSIVWKLLVRDVPVKEDLEGIDFSLVRSLDLLRNINMDPALYAATFFETFTTNSADDRLVELVPLGASRDVTYETRHQYCDLVLNYRLHEFDRQAAAIRSGLSTIVPVALLSLCTWSQLETLVCGKPEVDVSLLESVTDYSSCAASDTHIQYFWQAMRDFSHEERSALLRFTWGRSRLPLSAADFPQRFKLQSFRKSPPDAYYPVAHTCFFSLELPCYSSLEIMKEKLRYAIFNCEAIDGDDTGSGEAIAAMGWEE